MAEINSIASYNENIARRSQNSKPSIWDFDYIQSIESEYHQVEAYTKQIKKLKDEVRMMLTKVEDPLTQLEHIDMLQRLGLSYHFVDEVESILQGIFINAFDGDTFKNNLYATALQFRLLRQHRYPVPHEIFNVFKDIETGKFKACLVDDVKGMLSLYEACFYSIQGEIILEEARDFATKCLQEYMKYNNNKDGEDYLSILVGHALEVPLHWRVPRLEARWFIDLNRRRSLNEMNNPTLLELAKLDFNVVQSIHQEELKELSRWWKQIGLGEKMYFSRDRLPENYFWTVGKVFEPQFGHCRKMSTKIYAILTIFDDIYDLYGTLEELELFTDAFGRWELNAMDQLPNYMQICFLALYNFINQVAFDVLKEQGFHIIKYLKRAVVDLCKSFLLEAKWLYTGYTPSLKEYIENAWISITVPAVLVVTYFLVTNPITEEALKLFMEEYPNVIRQSSLICRLANDLATSPYEMKRGEAPSSIQSYMKEANVSEDKARQHIEFLMNETWKEMNKERAEPNCLLSHTFVEMSINLARMTMWLYERTDGFGVANHGITKDSALLLFINSIPLGNIGS